MQATVLDLPEAIEFARPLAESLHLMDVVKFKAHDLLTNVIDTPSDVFFLGNILHHFNREQILKILCESKSSLSENGTIAILEISMDFDNVSNDLMVAAMSLHFRMMSTSRCYTAEEYCSWLDGLGFKDIKVKKFFKSPVHRLIYARKCCHNLRPRASKSSKSSRYPE